MSHSNCVHLFRSWLVFIHSYRWLVVSCEKPPEQPQQRRRVNSPRRKQQIREMAQMTSDCFEGDLVFQHLNHSEENIRTRRESKINWRNLCFLKNHGFWPDWISYGA